MHISITGRLGSGKSTVAKIIAEKYGFEIVSTGTALRNIAAELGMTALEFNKLMTADPKYDYMIDNGLPLREHGSIGEAHHGRRLPRERRELQQLRRRR